MRKFTLYQASRYTKISRYKLEQAISDGKLVAIEGKGNVKCYIIEEELNKFIEKHSEQYKRFTYPEETNNKDVIYNEDIKYIAKDVHREIVDEKNKVIRLLEFQTEQLIPLLKTNQTNSGSYSELVSIAQEAIKELPSNKESVKESLSSKLESLI